jgi:hypothetical protein
MRNFAAFHCLSSLALSLSPSCFPSPSPLLTGINYSEEFGIFGQEGDGEGWENLSCRWENGGWEQVYSVPGERGEGAKILR